MNIDMLAMEDELGIDEGNVLYVYDDATGNLIKPGSHVLGNPTIGVGRNLSGNGITPAESAYLLANSINLAIGNITQALPWANNLDPVRQRVLVNMCFNMGIGGLLGFPHFLTAMQAGNWQTAAQEMQNSAWWKQVGQRAVRLQYMVLNGATQ